MTLNNEALQATVVDELRAAGLKATPQRIAIVSCLAGDETHPTAQEIFDRLRPEFPGMAFATVYNTLSALMRVGRLSSLSLGGAARFDPNVTPHHHAICERCGKVRDVAIDDFKEPPPSTVLDGFEVHRVERIYRGVCGECAGAEQGGVRADGAGDPA